MKIALFLGAGFSAHFGFPIMDTFISFAEDSNRITDKDKSFIYELVLDARRANSFLQSRPTNIEDILSFAVMGDRLGLKSSSNVERLPRIKKIIQKIYSGASDIGGYWGKYESFKNFLGFDLRQSDHQLSIITTNYDVNIESALHRCGQSADPGFQFNQIEANLNSQDNQDNLYTLKNGIPLFKLHGSVNWYEDANKQDSFLVEGEIGKLNSSEDKATSLPLICTTGYENKYTPVIIPPSFLKPEFRGPVCQIWAGAAKALEEAQIVAFVGYSFPSTDIEMRYFLARSFVNNARLRKIIIIDKQANKISERLKDNDSGFGSHFKDLLVPRENSWSNVTLDI